MAYLVTQPCTSKESLNISGSLAEGDIWGHQVTCPSPDATFAPPAREAVVAFGVWVAGTDIEVEMSERPSSTSSRRGA